MSNAEDIRKKLAEDPEFQAHAEKVHADPEFQKWMKSIEDKAAALAEHPYTKSKNILDTEFELVITYAKNGVPVGTCDHEGHPDGMEIIESILTDENEGALVTNDLEIIQITPDVEIVVFAEETKGNAVYKDEIVEFRDYTIYEYTRK